MIKMEPTIEDTETEINSEEVRKTKTGIQTD
jgi:hypothetical protein